MTARFTLEMSDEMLARIDEARGDVARNRWIRRALDGELERRGFWAVEQALSEPIGSTRGGTTGQGRGEPGSGRGAEAGTVASPATASAPAERPVRPYPKQGKR